MSVYITCTPAQFGRQQKPPGTSCSHPADRLRWEWRADPAMPGAEVLTAVCEVCGAVLPPRLPAAGVVTLVDMRLQETGRETEDPAAEVPDA